MSLTTTCLMRPTAFSVASAFPLVHLCQELAESPLPGSCTASCEKVEHDADLGLFTFSLSDGETTESFEMNPYQQAKVNDLELHFSEEYAHQTLNFYILLNEADESIVKIQLNDLICQ